MEQNLNEKQKSAEKEGMKKSLKKTPGKDEK